MHLYYEQHCQRHRILIPTATLHYTVQTAQKFEFQIKPIVRYTIFKNISFMNGRVACPSNQLLDTYIDPATYLYIEVNLKRLFPKSTMT
jgi:hypothetical protein